jgi:hypothetical protein
MMGGMALTSAKAADLGGDCCADLEERVAELEATTVRKGNRKVSLTISGQVSRAFGVYGDEFGDSELYSAGTGPQATMMQFAGSAEMVPGWTAGYTVRFRMNGDRSKDVLNYAGGALDTQYGTPLIDRNFVYLKNDHMGTFVIGQAGAPTDGVANISLGGRDVTGTSNGADWNRSRHLQGFDLEQDDRYQAIAWISPTVQGFTYAVAWADLDPRARFGALAGALNLGPTQKVDAIDMALRYAGEFGPIRVAAGIGATFLDTTEGLNRINQQVGADILATGWNLMGSAAVMHTPTGLNIAFAAGQEQDGGLPSVPGVFGYSIGNDAPFASTLSFAQTDASFWHVQGGVNRDFTGFGATSIYGEYGSYDYDFVGVDPVQMWGLGVVQNFDKAATELFVAYRQWSIDAEPGALVDGTFDYSTAGDVDQVMAGMRIKF